MDRLEQTLLLECLREVRGKIGFKTAESLVKRMITDEYKGPEQTVLDCINRKPVNAHLRTYMARIALEILVEKSEVVLSFFERRSVESARYLETLFRKYSVDFARGANTQRNEGGNKDSALGSQTSKDGGYGSTMVELWRKPYRKGNGILKTGVYQMYRRYKPTRGDAVRESGAPDDHVVVCELLYLNSDAMEGVLITSERNCYFGSLFINHKNVLSCLFLRRTKTGGIGQRFISVKLEGRALPVNSGICMKAGDTTSRPVAAECLVVRVPPGTNEQLYQEMATIAGETWTGHSERIVDENSVIVQYLTANPPWDSNAENWKRVKFIRDFDVLRELAHPNQLGIVLFPEPLRAMSVETLLSIGKTWPQPIFRE